MNIDKLKKLWKTVFGDTDAFIDSFFAIAYAPDRCQYLLQDGEPVSALYWFDCEYTEGKLAYIYAVATAPEQRGKGFASELMRQTHACLKERGYAGAILKPANGLFPFYGRLGYETCGYINQFTAAPADPIPVRELSTEEYASRRRIFLPENSVIQEGLTLDFFHTYAKFYDAGNALISVFPEDNFVFEYLGDPALAPGILGALSMPQTQCMTPGDQIPFVMHYPLNCTKSPGYLGITLE